MKRLIAVCVLIAVSMPACADNAKTGADMVREKYQNLETCKMSVDITADFGDRVGSYSVTYERSEGYGVITVVKPDEIAGITASIEAGDVSLSYDGLMLETGRLSGTALTPIDAVPTMLDTWASGYMTDAGSERFRGVKCYRLTYRSTAGESTIEQHAWFETDTLKPVHAETLVDGVLVISCDFIQVDC